MTKPKYRISRDGFGYYWVETFSTWQDNYHVMCGSQPYTSLEKAKQFLLNCVEYDRKSNIPSEVVYEHRS